MTSKSIYILEDYHEKTLTLSEQGWEKKLNIRTKGRDESASDEHNFPYEPTPYPVLERLAGSGLIGRDDHLLDYGCGKGRVCFFLAAECGCRSTGIDLSEKMIKDADKNLSRKTRNGHVDFLHCNAEEYKITDENLFFFFNPFTETVLHSVLGRIRESYYQDPRQIRIFCYYPSDEFIACLMTEPDIEFIDEIDCRDLFDGSNPRERILVFGL